MSRLSKILMVAVVVLFVLACNFVTRPVKDVQNLAGTAQAIGSAIPIETIQAFPSAIASVLPPETLEAFPTAVAPTIESVATALSDIRNPQGTPVQEWKDIPIMPQATVGQEFTENDTNIYSFKVNATAKDAQDFYKGKLTSLGWKEPLDMPVGTEGGIMTFRKDNSTLIITITFSEGTVLVMLTLV